jgi:glycosyltransferase involved in cell wall biosynthesis
MRILFINQCYWPDYVATAQILTDLSEELAKKGHQVTILCSRKPYMGGAAYPGYDCRNGVDIVRVATLGFGKAHGILGRILDFLSFYIAATFKCLSLKRFDVVVTLTSPPMIGLLGWFLMSFRRMKHIHWCMDVFPDGFIVNGVIKRTGFIYFILSSLNRLYIKTCSAVFVISTHMRWRMQLYGADEDRLYIVPVWADGRKLKPVKSSDNWFAKKYQLKDKFVVMYSGNMAMGSDLGILLEAASRLKKEKDILFLFIGGGVQLEKLKEAAGQYDLDNVSFLPYQNTETLPYSLSAADVHIVTVKPGFGELLVPCKTYGIMAVARPIIYIGDRNSEVADLVEQNNIGFIIDWMDVDGLVAAIRRLKNDSIIRRDISKRARSLFEAKYNAEIVINRFDEIMTRIFQ